jgi:hypothetical protein
MKRFPCRSSLGITYQTGARYGTTIGRVLIRLEQHSSHVEYFDVTMPEEALAMIHEHIEWLSPVAMVTKIRTHFPDVTAKQVHTAWTKFSEPHWRKDDDQMLSAEMLLEEFEEDVDLFQPEDLPEGVEILCWGMKRIARPLEGKTVEIGVDATC